MIPARQESRIGRAIAYAMLLCICMFAAPVLAETSTEDEPVESSGTSAQVQAETPPAVGNQPADHALENVIQVLRSDLEKSRARMQDREADFRARRDKARQRLASANAKMQAEETRGGQLEADFESNRVELDDKAKLLKDKLGALKELFGVFQQNASDLIGAFNGSATSLQYPRRDEWLEGFANRMKNASEVSSIDDIMGLWFEMQREITALGDIVRLRSPVVTTQGETSEREIVRIGGFSLISGEPSPAYLFWSDAGQEVVEIPRQPEANYLAKIDRYLNADEGLQTVAVDPTGGVLTTLLVQKPTLEERIHQGGLVGYIILGLGALALVLALYKLFDITLISLRVMRQQKDLANPRDNNVLGWLLNVYQRNLHVDVETLQMRLHEVAQKAGIRVNRYTVFLGIIAAVAPLLGLLGTVVGMINTFQAITLYGTGDPQTMAGGISQALITTVLGLVVAVPSVLLLAVVSGRGKVVVNVIQELAVALTGDRMHAQHQEDLNQTSPDGGNLDAQSHSAPA